MATIDLRVPRQVNFLTLEKDMEKLVEKIISSKNILKLLYYSTIDALDREDILDNETLNEVAKSIRLEPNLEYPKNESSFLVITFDSFSPNGSNQMFLDNNIFIDVLCPIKYWQMDNYMSRPFRLMHEIQSLLDKQKLNGIGKVNFAGANLLNLGDYAGYQMAYSVVNDV